MIMPNIFNKFLFYLSYFRKPPWDTGISPPELFDFIKSNPPGKALDVGCGTGTNAITLAKHGWQVTGIDFIPHAIKKACSKARKENLFVRFIVQDVTRLYQLTDKFDLILDIGCYHSLPVFKLGVYSDNLNRLLAPEGVYLLYGFCDKSDSGAGLTPTHFQALEKHLNLTRRENGFDHQHPSAWLTYQRK